MKKPPVTLIVAAVLYFGYLAVTLALDFSGGVLGRLLVAAALFYFVFRGNALNNKSKLLVGEVIPTINLINSHNGKSKFHLFSGMFRLVCSNGLIIADKGNAEMEQMRHAASLVDEVIKRMRAAAARVTQTTRQIEHWRNVELSETEVTAFATRALELRFGESAKAYDVETALQTRRDEDAGRTMWRVLNRVQENLSKGGVIGRSALGRQIRSRALNGITADVAFNKGIWELAEGIAG